MGKRKYKSGSLKILGSAWFVVLALLAACAAQKGPETKSPADAKPEVSAVRVEKADANDRVVIETNPPSMGYSVYKWMDPVRIVVDFADAVAAREPSTISVADGLIKGVDVKGIKPDGQDATSLVRVIINLEKNAEYEVNREDGKLVVSLAKSASADAGSAEQAGLAVMQGDSESGAANAQDWAWAGPAGAAAADTGAAAKKLVSVSVSEDGDMTRVSLLADGAVGDYSAFTLENPDRLVIDMWGVKNPSKIGAKSINQQGILRVRAGEHEDKLRLVFDANGDLPHYRFDKDGNRLVVTFSRTMDVSVAPGSVEASATETASSATSDKDWPVMDLAQNEWSGPQPSSTASEWSTPSAPAPAPVGAPPAVSPTLDWGPQVTLPPNEREAGIANIDYVKFDFSNSASSIVIHADRPIRRESWRRQDNPDEKIVSFFIGNAQVAADQQRSYDTTEFQSPIELFSVFQRPTQQNEVAIIVVMRNWAASKWNQYDEKLVIQFENYPGSLGLGGAATTGMFGPMGEEVTGGTGAPGAMAPGVSGVPSATTPYTGASVSLDFKNMDILDALRTIAEVSNMNIVVADNVRGKITIKLDSVPWDQALDLILDTKGLGKVEQGNIIRIAPQKDLQKEKADRLAELEAQRKYEELTTKIIPVNYLKAQDLSRVVRPILTPGRGKVDADKRTNSIIIRDIPAAVEEAYKMISTLDKPTKQVLIEARIVEATVGVTREIGVQWGTNYNVGPATGNPTGLDFPGTIQLGGAALGGTSGSGAVTGLSPGGGALGISVGSLSNAVSLDVALRTLEAQERIKIISSPRVLTLTDERAMIEQGVSIPYPPPSIVGGGAVGWTFVEASLQLEVTPHVAADNSIIMDIKCANNEPVSIAGSSQPGISKKEAQTTIMLKDGETAVIGGIFKIRKSQPRTLIPFLGSLPVIGTLFSDRIDESRNEELIIFLTPQIIEAGRGVGDQGMGGGFSGLR
ncbi:MAG TPA: type IV pilus secretin PilQ [bacterium]|nr:type IV pilus secretin PilQ [bacterium]